MHRADLDHSATAVASHTGATGRPGSAWRGVALGLLLVFANVSYLLLFEHVYASAYSTMWSLFANVVCSLFVVSAGNTLLARRVPRWALSRRELATVYAMSATASALVGIDWLPGLVQTISEFSYRSAAGSGWQEWLGSVMPRWAIVDDSSLLKGYFQGHSTLYRRDVLALWASPLLAWIAFILALVALLMCTAALFRKRWEEQQRLTFPLAQLPLLLCEEGGGVFRSVPLWAGFAVAGTPQILHVLHRAYPAVPDIGVYLVDSLGASFSERPWSALGWTPMTLYPGMVGISFLLPVDVLLSCWVFYWCFRAQHVVAAAFGLDAASASPRGVFPLVPEQMVGSYLAMVAVLLSMDRQHLLDAWRRAIGRASPADDAGEPLTYRQAFLGVIVSFAVLCAFALRMGMTPALVPLFFGIYLVLALYVARVRAELGPPVHDLHFSGPDFVLPMLAGTAVLGRRNMAVMAVLCWFNRAHRCHPVGSIIESLHMSSRTGLGGKRVVLFLLVATLAASCGFLWLYLHFAYRTGVENWRGWGTGYGWESFARAASWLQEETHVGWRSLGGVLAGAVVTLALSAMRMRITGWPLHPVGYAMSASWQINLIWFPMFVAWLLKALTLRYGGLRLLRRATPFFMGLILGEFVVGCLCTIVSYAVGVSVYPIWEIR